MADEEIDLSEFPVPDLPDEEEPEVEVAEETATSEPAPEPEPQPDIAAELARLREEHDRLKRERQEEQRKLAEIASERDQTNLSLLQTTLERIQTGQSQLKAAYAQAASEGDWSTAADIQAQMAQLANRATILENGIDAAKSNPRQYMPPADPVESKAQAMTPASADWIRRNAEWAKDDSKFQRVIGAHYIATGEGIAVDTPAYFKRVEEVLGIRQEPLSVASQPVESKAPPAAPTSPNGAGPGNRKNVVRLTREERETAALMGFSPEEYAKSKLALQKSGELK